MRTFVGKNFSWSSRRWAWPRPPLESLITRSICLMPSAQMIEAFSHQEVIETSIRALGWRWGRPGVRFREDHFRADPASLL